MFKLSQQENSIGKNKKIIAVAKESVGYQTVKRKITQGYHIIVQLPQSNFDQFSGYKQTSPEGIWLTSQDVFLAIQICKWQWSVFYPFAEEKIFATICNGRASFNNRRASEILGRMAKIMSELRKAKSVRYLSIFKSASQEFCRISRGCYSKPWLLLYWYLRKWLWTRIYHHMH